MAIIQPEITALTVAIKALKRSETCKPMKVELLTANGPGVI